MAVDYNDITAELVEILRADDTLQNCSVVLEEELTFSLDMMPRIGVYFIRRSAPPGQPIAAGGRQRYQLEFSIMVFVGGLEMPAVISQRNDILAKVESVLIRNRSINNRVMSSWLEGGVMPSGKDPKRVGVVAGGEIGLTAELEFNG